MRYRFHSDERGGERERLGERYCAPRISGKTGKGGVQLLWQRSGQLGLHEGRAADNRDPETVCRIQQGDAIRSNCLRRKPHRLCHREVYGKLDDLEVVLAAADFMRYGKKLLEA